ncbi:MAG: hypothetical protein ACE5OZ_08845 [Candidatus Heimdallarchaeota archaeon]
MTSPARRTSGRKFKPVKRLPRKKTSEDGAEQGKKQAGKSRLTPNSKLYFTKLGLGACTGTLAGLLALEPLFGWIMVIVGLTLAAFIVRHVYQITEEQLDQKRLILSGTFSFILITIVTWSLVWMLTTANLPSPR